MRQARRLAGWANLVEPDDTELAVSGGAVRDREGRNVFHLGTCPEESADGESSRVKVRLIFADGARKGPDLIFVEAEDVNGKGVCLGRWLPMGPDGFHRLEFEVPRDQIGGPAEPDAEVRP